MDEQKLEATLSVILDTLKDVQSEVAQMKEDNAARFDSLEAHIGALERGQISIRHDLSDLRRDTTDILSHLSLNYERAIGELQHKAF